MGGRADERGIADLAGRQLGVVTRRQLEACGVGRGAIAGRVERGSLIRTDRGVYAVGRPARDPLARHLAGALSISGPAWLRSRSAAAAWGVLPPTPSEPVQVCVVGDGARSRGGLDVRRLRTLHPADRTARGPLPVTGLARTIVDLAEDLEADDLERCFAEAIAVHGLTTGAVAYALERRGRFPGIGGVRRLLASSAGPQRTRSELEAVLRALVREADLPAPRINAPVGRFVVDALWPDQRVIAEADGFAFHRSRRRFEDDRRRDAELQAGGYVVVRMTWRHLTEDALATAARLGAILAVRRDAGATGLHIPSSAHSHTVR